MWTKDSIEISVPEGGDFQITGIRGTSETTFACGFTSINNTINETYYFLMRKNNKWAVVDSFVITSSSLQYKWGGGLWMPKEGYLFSYGSGGIFRWNGSNWQNFFGDISPAFVDGTDLQYIYAVGGFGQAYFYNGYEWKQIKAVENPNILFSGVWTDGKEAFIIGFTQDGYPQKTVVYHGK